MYVLFPWTLDSSLDKLLDDFETTFVKLNRTYIRIGYDLNGK